MNGSLPIAPRVPSCFVALLVCFALLGSTKAVGAESEAVRLTATVLPTITLWAGPTDEQVGTSTAGLSAIGVLVDPDEQTAYYIYKLEVPVIVVSNTLWEGSIRATWNREGQTLPDDVALSVTFTLPMSLDEAAAAIALTTEPVSWIAGQDKGISQFAQYFLTREGASSGPPPVSGMVTYEVWQPSTDVRATAQVSVSTSPPEFASGSAQPTTAW